MAHKYGATEISTVDIGKMTKLKDKGNSFQIKMKNMKVNG